ncbi:MAG: NTP transferase domain-containing protein [Bacteroidota bacterium]
MTVGIILAAGESVRMGAPKALLPLGGKSFIRTIIENHFRAGVDRVIVVLGAQADVLRAEVEPLNVAIAINKDYQRGQLSSVHAGVKTAVEFAPDAILLHPVDHPFILSGTIRAMIETFSNAPGGIIIPVHKGKRGHPVLFSATLVPDLLAAPHDIGARAVVWNHSADVYELETDDSGVLKNIDTPEAYEHL